EHLCDVPSTEAALLFVDPLTQGSATLWMQTAASLPELLGDVVPVDAGHSFGKVLLIAVPDVVRAVCEKEAALATVAATLGVLDEPAEERFVTFEGCDEALVDRPLPPLPRLAECVDDADEGELGVLALIALLTSWSWMLTSSSSSCVSASPLLSSLRAPPSSVLRRRDHRRAAPIDLDDVHLAVVVRSRRGIEEAARFGPDSVYHAQRCPRARGPLVK